MVDTKEAYLEKLKAKMAEWNAQIDMLKAKAAQSKADAKIEIEKRVGDLETHRQEVEHKIQQLVQASGPAWEDLKVGVKSAWNKLDEAVRSATEKFK
jgi:chromosome segregation ATPase